MEKMICSGELGVLVKTTESGAAICGVFDGEKEVCASDARLFRLRASFDGEEKKLDSLSGWEVFFAGDTLNFVRTGLTVSVTAHPNGGNGIEWTTSFAAGKGVSVKWVSFPDICFPADEAARLYHSEGPGRVFGNLPGRKISARAEYPSTSSSMQFMSIWNENARRGIYYGVHDVHAALKKFSYKKEADWENIELFVECPAENMTSEGNSQTLPGPAVWKLRDGDWYDDCMIYREFVTSQLSWIPEGPVRRDIPDWLLKMPHWWLDSVDADGKYVETMIKATEDIGVPCAVHLYNWHRNPFDNDYPHFFPAKDVFLNTFTKLQEHGIRVMPYINGRLWDTRDRGAEDWLFSSEGKAGAAKNPDGSVITESYGSKEADGSDVKLAVMCPTSAVWCDKVRELTKKLLQEVGVDGVYIDQIAATSPALCCDPGHKHPAGGGRWWAEGYRRMLEAIVRENPKSCAITSECTADAYTRDLDAMLSWDRWFDGQVPGCMAVYAGYIIHFGRNYSGADSGGIRISCAQSLLFGEQMGWIAPSIYLSMQHKEFYVSAVRTRYKYNEFFWGGRPLRPPVVSCGLPEVEGKVMLDVMHSPPVLSAVWEKYSGGRLLLIVNISEKPAEVSLRSEYLASAPELGAPAVFDGEELRLTVPAETVLSALI